MSAQILQFPKKLLPQDERYFAAQECFNYFNNLYILTKNAFEKSNSVLGGAHNLFGEHKKDTKDVFLSFFNNPCSENWLVARNYLVSTNTTAWQLWIKYDKNAPRSGSTPEYPKPDDFIRYFNQYKIDRLEELKSRCDEAEKIIMEYAK